MQAPRKNFRPRLALGVGLWLLASCGDGVDREERGASGGAEGLTESTPVETSSGPRHVLLIVIDTLRADHLSCYGYWRETSPHMDAMAEAGVRFERAISQSSWTAPSMITLMTGQRLSRKRMKLPEDKPTLAELFVDAGYRTGAWVSNPLLNDKNGFRRGFQEWTRDQLREVDEAVAWLHENAEHDTFTWIHFTDPHDPYKPARADRTKTLGRLSPEQEALIRDAAERAEDDASLEEQRDFIAKQVGLYDDEIVAVDRKVGQLIEALREDGNLERAIVVLTSDHGECLWERRESETLVAHQRKTRGTPSRVEHLLKQTHGEYVYQELVRVPLLIMAPGLEPATIEGRVAEAVHLAPTLLALAEVRVEGVEEMLGKNLFGEAIEAGAYTMTNQGEAFLSEDGWKLILPTEEGKQPYGHVLQLYDLNNDPGERENLASAEPERVAELTARIEARRASALPLQKAGDWESQTRANAKALQELGYADGGLPGFGESEPLDAEDPHEESHEELDREPLDPSPKSQDGL